MFFLLQAVLAFENKLELFIADVETGRQLPFVRLKDACTASNPTQHFDLQQLVGFTSNLLQSFKVGFGEFRECTCFIKFIPHPHECAVNNVDLTYIPGFSIIDLE